MFESIGEVLVLGVAILVTWLVAYGWAERRVTSSVSDSYELQILRARQRINTLETELAGDHLTPAPSWADFELGAASVTDPGLKATA